VVVIGSFLIVAAIFGPPPAKRNRQRHLELTSILRNVSNGKPCRRRNAMTDNQDSAIGYLADHNLAQVHRFMRLATCFAAMRDFEKRASSAKGIAGVCFGVTDIDGDCHAGSLMVRFEGDDIGARCGSWSVNDEGVVDFELEGASPYSGDGHGLRRHLSRAWSEGDFRRCFSALSKRRQAARPAA
jgi:hypothetical protein